VKQTKNVNSITEYLNVSSLHNYIMATSNTVI